MALARRILHADSDTGKAKDNTGAVFLLPPVLIECSIDETAAAVQGQTSNDATGLTEVTFLWGKSPGSWGGIQVLGDSGILQSLSWVARWS